MGTRKCTARQLAALKRGREKLHHKRSRKRTGFMTGDDIAKQHGARLAKLIKQNSYTGFIGNPSLRH